MFVSDCEELLKIWDYDKNNEAGISPNEISCYSRKKAYWKCIKGHSYFSKTNSVFSGSRCPYCAGKSILIGYNDLLTTNPDLASEWNKKRNGDLTPLDFSKGSHKSVFWTCSKCGYEWEASILSRSKGNGCPLCANKVASAGINDLMTLFPEALEDWDYNENPFTPNQVLPHSSIYANFICKNNHHYKQRISDHTSGSRCPYCARRKILVGFNDLVTENPELAKEWHPNKNNIGPEKYMPNSSASVWWLGKCGHEWKATIRNRSSGKSGCPCCDGKKILVGFNDLMTKNPDIAKQWYYPLNNPLTPKDVTISSGRKVFWKCKKGHIWKATIADRNTGYGCPICNAEKRTSFPEKILLYYVLKVFPDAISNYSGKELKKSELDVFIPSEKIGIEYDGELFHKKTEKDKTKDDLCEKCGIVLIRIREPNCPKYESSSIKYYMKAAKDYDDVANYVLNTIREITKISFDIDVNVERDNIDIISLVEHLEKEKSISKVVPELAKEWLTEKNAGIESTQISYGSNQKFWWRCSKCGFEFKSSPNRRYYRPACPNCSKRIKVKN